MCYAESWSDGQCHINQPALRSLVFALLMSIRRLDAQCFSTLLASSRLMMPWFVFKDAVTISLYSMPAPCVRATMGLNQEQYPNTKVIKAFKHLNYETVASVLVMVAHQNVFGSGLRSISSQSAKAAHENETRLAPSCHGRR